MVKLKVLKSCDMNMIQVVAFVLEAFFAELDIESSENGEEQDQVSIF